MTRKLGPNAFFFVIVTVAIDMLAFGLIIPVLPALIEDVMGLGPAEAVAWGGALTATYALMNFAFGPAIGALSDRFGRRPVLLASIFTLAIDFVVMGLANTIWLLFLGRALSGVSGATFSTANAYIADTTSPEERGRAFGMIGAAFGFGFVFGPVMGGFLGEVDPRAPFFVAAALSACNFIYGWFVLPESLPQDNRRAIDWTRANPFGAFNHFSKLPHVSWFLIVLGVFGLAHSVYPATWSFHGEIRYDWSSREIGFSLGLVGIGAAIVQAGLMGMMLKHLGPARTAVFGLVMNILPLIAFSLAGKAWMAYLIIPFSALGGVAQPAVNSIMSTRTPKNAQGELQGATASIQALAMIISPLVMTQTLHTFSTNDAPIYFPGAAFLLAAALTALALIPLFRGLAIQLPDADSGKELASAANPD